MIDWSPVDPDLPLSELWGETCYAESADGRGLFLTVGPTPPGLPVSPGDAVGAERVRVLTHTSYGVPRRNFRDLPAYLPVRAACIARALVPHRILITPEAQWPVLRQPTVATDAGRLSLRELVRQGPPASVVRQGALATADTVKTMYGRMLVDVAYRIEQSALFDPSVPTTRSFDNALAAWGRLDLSSAPDDEVVHRANVLKLAFDTARAHAETVGLAHLPAAAQAEARRAAGAARLAFGSGSSAEREAAQAQVVRILDSLALHYLPSAEAARKAITASP